MTSTWNAYGSFNWCSPDYDMRVLWLQNITWSGDSLSVVQQAIFGEAEFDISRTTIREANPGLTHSFDYWQIVGFRDMDGDGDSDLIVHLSGVRHDGDSNVLYQFYEYVWLENTGFEADPPLAADINGDGIVDGKDLASVLSAWTP